MTQDEIIEMAREASGGAKVPDILLPVFERFAKLVAQHEREACAKLIETTDLGGISSDPKLQNFIASLLFGYAQTIRARGQA
jgi:hypothetical protein